MKESYLITGATGLIGHHLVNILLGMDVIVYATAKNAEEIERKWPEEVKYNRVIPVKWNMERSIPKIVPRVDYIIHTAAVIPGKGYSEDEILKINVMGVNNIVKFAKKHLIKKLIYLSSAAVYGERLNKNSIPIKEEESRNVDFVELNAYGLSKRMSEEELVKLSKKELYCNIIRLFKVYGEGIVPNKQGDVVQNILWQALYEKKIIINGNAKAIRNFLYVTDAVKIILALCKEESAHLIYNVGSFSENHTIYEYANALARLAGKEVIYDKKISIEGRAQIPDLERLSKLNEMKMITLQEGVNRMYNMCKGTTNWKSVL